MNTQVLAQQAALINREGIGALACGYGEKAHGCFKNVLEIMGHITASPDLLVEESPTSNSSISTSVFTPVAVPNIRDERFFVYNCALLFSTREEDRPISQMDITLFSAAAIFNIALTYHQRAMQVKSEKLFRTSSRMYGQAMQIMNSLATYSSLVADVNALRVIIMNNKSQILFELEDFEKAEQTLEDIRKLSRYLSSNDSNTTSILQEGAYDEITLNVLTTAPPSTAPCA